MSGGTVGTVAELRPLGAQFAWANRAVLVVDIVESVRLIEQDEVKIIGRWLALTEDVKSILPQHGGRYVKGLGDGMLLGASCKKIDEFSPVRL